MDVLKRIKNKLISITITTPNDKLASIIEPNVSVSSKRFKAMKKLNENNIPCGIMLLPVLPFITDKTNDIKKLIKLAYKNHARFIYPSSMGMTLSENQRTYFYKKLDESFPNLKEKYRKIYNDKTIKKTQRKMKLLGFNKGMDPIRFLNLRLFTTFIVFFVVLYITSFGYILAPIISVLYYFLCGKILLDNKIKKRSEILEDEAMHFFEVLTLSLETGRNLEEAFLVTINSVSSSLSLEFKEALREVKYGKSLTEALIGVQERIPSETINNIILTLTQADLFGNGIIDTMYNQIDYLREKRKLEVKAAISKVPIKISIISVLFFVPLILLLILAPVILNYIN